MDNTGRTCQKQVITENEGQANRREFLLTFSNKESTDIKYAVTLLDRTAIASMPTTFQQQRMTVGQLALLFFWLPLLSSAYKYNVQIGTKLRNDARVWTYSRTTSDTKVDNESKIWAKDMMIPQQSSMSKVVQGNSTGESVEKSEEYEQTNPNWTGGTQVYFLSSQLMLPALPALYTEIYHWDDWSCKSKEYMTWVKLR